MNPTRRGRAAPTPNVSRQRGALSKRALIVLAAGIAAAIIGGLLILVSRDASGPLQPRLAARQTTTLKIIADGQKYLVGGDLKKLNSDMNIVLGSDNATIQATLKAAGMKKVDKDVSSAEADSSTFEKLTDARLNGRYNQTYQDVITLKLESLRELVRELHEATHNKGLKTALNEEYKHLSEFINSLENLN